MKKILEPRIIFDGEQLLVINKPAGWLTHPAISVAPPLGQGDGLSITGWLIALYPQLAAIGGEEKLQDDTMIPRAGILHRLDRETSGVLAAAKTGEAFDWFTKAFRERKVAKVYRAIVSGVLKLDDGVINLPIGRSRQDPRKRVAGNRASGVLREALTRYHVLERFIGFTYLELKPETGRTHQLRVHLKALQTPIIGDQLYAPKGPIVPTINRTALHAFSLTLPFENSEKKSFEAPLPEDFNQTLDYLRRAC